VGRPWCACHRLEYNLDVEEDIKPSEEDLMLSRSTGGGASAARRTQVGVAADKKGKCRAPVSAAAKKQTAIPPRQAGQRFFLDSC
jgi:hypothetical protein